MAGIALPQDFCNLQNNLGEGQNPGEGENFPPQYRHLSAEPAGRLCLGASRRRRGGTPVSEAAHKRDACTYDLSWVGEKNILRLILLIYLTAIGVPSGRV